MTSFNHDFKSQPGQMQQATGNNRSEAFSNRPGKPVNQIRQVTSRSRVKSGAAPSARHIEMPHRIQSPGPGGPSRPARPYIKPTPCSSDSDPSIPPSRHSPSALRSRIEHHLPWFQKKKKKKKEHHLPRPLQRRPHLAGNRKACCAAATAAGWEEARSLLLRGSTKAWRAMMSSVPVPEMFAVDQHLAPQQPAAVEQEQLCYVHCKCCDTILAVRIGSAYVWFRPCPRRRQR